MDKEELQKSKKNEHSQKRGATYVHTLVEALAELHCKRTECDFYGQNNPGLVNHQRQTHTAVTLHCSRQYKQKMMPKEREILQANSRFHNGSQNPIPRSSFRSGLHHFGRVKAGHWWMDGWHVCVSVYKCPSDSDAVEPAYCNSVVWLWLWHCSNRNFFRKMTRRSAPKGRISHIVWLPPYCLTLRLHCTIANFTAHRTLPLHEHVNMSTQTHTLYV